MQLVDPLLNYRETLADSEDEEAELKEREKWLNDGLWPALE